MSIIERALEKGRAADQKRSRRLADADGGNEIEPKRQATDIDATARILPLAVTLDNKTSRERRILMQDSDDQDSGAVAAYRMLRTRLLHRAQTNKWSTIAITSAGANDGKTLTALNLALSMSREKSRQIVLLDLDMRNPSVCRTLGVHPPLELRSYLEHGENVRQLFFSVAGDNLLIAGGQSSTTNASELLASPRFEELLRFIRQGTTDPIVLLDLPPVLLTDDALVVAPKVDAMMLVVSEGVTARDNFSKALDVLSDFPLAGVVLNRAAESAPGYGYEYGSDPR